MSEHQQQVFAIIDNLTNEIVQSVLPIYKHEAAAIRDFGAIMSTKGPIATNPKDHDLVRLGFIHSATNELVPDYQVVMTGARWLAAQAGHNEGPTS